MVDPTTREIHSPRNIQSAPNTTTPAATSHQVEAAYPTEISAPAKNAGENLSNEKLFLPPEIINTPRSEEHTSELQSLMRISYAVFCLKKKKTKTQQKNQ